MRRAERQLFVYYDRTLCPHSLMLVSSIVNPGPAPVRLGWIAQITYPTELQYSLMPKRLPHGLFSPLGFENYLSTFSATHTCLGLLSVHKLFQPERCNPPLCLLLHTSLRCRNLACQISTSFSAESLTLVQVCNGASPILYHSWLFSLLTDSQSAIVPSRLQRFSNQTPGIFGTSPTPSLLVWL